MWDSCSSRDREMEPSVTTRLVGQGPVLWCLREVSRAQPGMKSGNRKDPGQPGKFRGVSKAWSGAGVVMVAIISHSPVVSQQVCSDQTGVRDTGLQVRSGSELGLHLQRLGPGRGIPVMQQELELGEGSQAASA